MIGILYGFILFLCYCALESGAKRLLEDWREWQAETQMDPNDGFDDSPLY